MKIFNLFVSLVIVSLMFIAGTGCQQSNKPTQEAKQGQELIDSLKTALKTVKTDTTKVNILNDLSKYAGWQINENDAAIDYAQQALDLATKANFKNGMAVAHNNMANAIKRKRNYEEAFKHYFIALELYKETKNKLWEGRIYNNMANTYRELSDFPNALKYYALAEKLATETDDQVTIAYIFAGFAYTYNVLGKFPEAMEKYRSLLKIYKETENKQGEVYIYTSIGGVFAMQGKYPEALQEFYTALRITEEIGDKNSSDLAYTYTSIGEIHSSQKNYSEALKQHTNALHVFTEIGDKYGMAYTHNAIGETYRHLKEYPQALDNLSIALKLSKEIGEERVMANVYGNIGSVYEAQGNYQEALRSYFDAVKLLEKVTNQVNIAYAYSAIGAVYVKLNQPLEGKKWLQKSLTLSSEMGTKDITKSSYEGLSKADSASGYFKGAYENYKLFNVYKDSLYNEENTKKLTQTSMQYEFDKKQLADSLQNVQVKKLAAEKLSKQKTYTTLGAALAFILLGFSFFIFRNNKKLDKEKKKSENLLLNILPTEVAEELKEKGSADAKQFDEVSVLFTDFVHFTQTSEQLSPQQLVQELNECFTAFDNIIEQNGLEKIKTIGDAYLAVCGLPNENEQHAKKTVQAALEIRDFIAKRKQTERTFDIRIGIHSGSVVAGIVGVKKFAYDIWGDTVNTAARMESSGEAGKINISAKTYQLIKDEFEFEYRGKIDAKGKGEIDMYFVS
ncbi:MAG: tetratricopeptide repeat protein [Chitinophagaceae bacterium]|nr:tetratricopeptide repeat protein [Chitinophagaceae bacterium]MCW5906138.1 tetratricopeptide repeat protein [Chitinophagaceae bacterium]